MICHVIACSFKFRILQISYSQSDRSETEVLWLHERGRRVGATCISHPKSLADDVVTWFLDKALATRIRSHLRLDLEANKAQYLQSGGTIGVDASMVSISPGTTAPPSPHRVGKRFHPTMSLKDDVLSDRKTAAP